MTLTPHDIERLPAVCGTLYYLTPMAQKPHNLAYDPPAGVPRTNQVAEAHTVPIRDMRPIAGDLSLDREGIGFVAAPTAQRDFDDADELRRVLYPETERVVLAATGGNRALVFDHTIRRRVWGDTDRKPGMPRQPVTRVHNDYTLKSGPQRVRDLMGEEADELLKRRFQIINLWRPIRGPLEDAPLALADAGSVAFGDFVGSDLIYRDRTGETYAVTYRPQHRWFYAPAMREDEAILIKSYDSATDGSARFAPHTSFEDPTAPADKLPRESIELRLLVFHPG